MRAFRAHPRNFAQPVRRESQSNWRYSTRLLLTAASAIIAAAPARAGETITYTYDARGRLVQVNHSGTVNAGTSATYSYDKADNRTNVTIAGGGSGGTGGTCSGVSFAVGNDSAPEGSNLVFSITKTGSASISCSVSYSTANGTAAAGSDYTAKSGALTFTSTQASKSVAVATTDDSTVENNETVKLNLSNPTDAATITDSVGNGTIADNDAVSDCSGVSFAVRNDSVPEGSNLVFSVTKTGSASISCSVSYSTANGTASAGSDYTAKSGALTFTSTQTSKSISVATTDDSTVETNETVKLNLSSPTGGATVSDSVGVGTINDDDTAADCSAVSFSVSDASGHEGDPLVFTVRKGGSASTSCSVHYATADGTAVAPTHYTATSGTLTFSSAQTLKTVSVSTVNLTSKFDKTLYLNLSAPGGGSTLSDGQAIGTIFHTGIGGCITCLQSAGTDTALQPDSSDPADVPSAPSDEAAPPPDAITEPEGGAR